MRSKNSRPIDTAEREYLAWIKEQPCSCCGAPGPSEAHHLVQGDHFTTIPLCIPCHRGPKGLHGDQSLLLVRHKTEFGCLNETVRRRCGAAPRERIRSALTSSKIIKRAA
jgi:hypothetical protein